MVVVRSGDDLETDSSKATIHSDRSSSTRLDTLLKQRNIHLRTRKHSEQNLLNQYLSSMLETKPGTPQGILDVISRLSLPVKISCGQMSFSMFQHPPQTW